MISSQLPSLPASKSFSASSSSDDSGPIASASDKGCRRASKDPASARTPSSTRTPGDDSGFGEPGKSSENGENSEIGESTSVGDEGGDVRTRSELWLEESASGGQGG